jgi:hypothetical protein
VCFEPLDADFVSDGDAPFNETRLWPFLAAEAGLEPLVRRGEATVEGLLLAFDGADRSRDADLDFEARRSAFTKSSLRIELQPDSPFLLAMSARSFQDCVFSEAVVIKGPNLRWNLDRAHHLYATVDSLGREVVRD